VISVVWLEPLRRLLLQPLVWTVAVIVPGVLGQDAAEVPLAEDQHVVQALAAQRANEPFRECVRPRRSDRRPDHPRAVPGKDFIERRGELAVPVADQELELPGPITEVHHQVAGLLGSPCSGRMGGDAEDVHGSGLDLHHEQHVHAPEKLRIDVQEVARQQA
jgi:hypothetical protein